MNSKFELEHEKETTQIDFDNLRFVSATSSMEHTFYDNGDGPLWIMQNSLSIDGIIRARTWEDAYAFWEAEIAQEVTADDAAEFEKEYSTIYESGRDLWLIENPGKNYEDFNALSEEERKAIYLAPGKDVPFNEDFTDHPCWQEAYGFKDGGKITGFYYKDLNGERLDPLSMALMEKLGIRMMFEPKKKEA